MRQPGRYSPSARRESPPRPKSPGKAAFSYYASRPKNSAASVWWQRNWVKNLPSLIALAAVTICVLYSLGLSTKPRIVLSGQTGVKLRDVKVYQQEAQSILSRSITSRTKFTVNIDGFEKVFMNEFPEVSDVSITLPLIGRRPVVNIVTARPVMLLTARGQAYVLDRRGQVIMRAADLDSTLRSQLPVVNDQSGMSVSLGQSVLPSKSISYVTTVLAQLKTKQLKTGSLILPAVPRELDVRIDGQPYFIKFDLDTNDREAVGSFLAVKQYLDENKIVPSAYVDVRVPGRAYYK